MKQETSEEQAPDSDGKRQAEGQASRAKDGGGQETDANHGAERNKGEGQEDTRGHSEEGQGGRNDAKDVSPITRCILPTPDAAEWASHLWRTGEAFEGVWESTRGVIQESARELTDLHWEALQQRKPHQATTVCQFWALAGAGIKGPGTMEEPEAQGK